MMYEQHVTHTEFAKTQKRIEELEAKVEDETKRLKALLEKYGGHKHTCAGFSPESSRYGKCDCGWDEARVQK